MIDALKANQLDQIDLEQADQNNTDGPRDLNCLQSVRVYNCCLFFRLLHI